MLQATLFFGWFALIALVAVGWRSVRRREIAWQRLAEGNQTRAEGERVPVGVRRLQRRWIWAPWGLALIVAGVTALVSRFSMPYVVALGVMVGFLASQLESFLAARHAATLEGQLADAIDVLIGAVDAGAGVGAAIDAAITECRAPLRPYLEEVKGRIQLGDEPAEVFRSLAQRVPLEAFLLFTSALAVHWEVGGKLSSTLTTVGRTIRDRIDVARRIRSNTAQSQFSTLAIIGLTYFIAVIVWRNGPEQMEEFVRSSVGSWFVAGSVVLQAVGIVWMNLISKPRF